MMKQFVSACVLCLAGCAEKAPTQGVVDGAAPAPVAAAKPKSTVDKGAPGRLSRFEARPVIKPMESLPLAWRTAAEVAKARRTRAFHERATRVDRGASSERRELQLRLFGTDRAVDARVIALLKAYELPGLPTAGLPKDAIEIGAHRWTLDIQRYKAPEGAARESIVTVTWQRSGEPAPEGGKPCKKPPPLKPSKRAAAWFERLTTARSTRRLVTAARDLRPEAEVLTRRMLYRNGLARDEAIGQFTKAARRAGFEQEGRPEGLSQTWVHPNGAKLFWRNDTSPLRLGCEIAGPMLRLSLSQPRTP